MPKLDTPLHLNMYAGYKDKRSLRSRLKRAWKILFGNQIYGIEWGDPDKRATLRYVKEHFLLPYLNPDQTVVEIGVGGGRWTRYMVEVQQLYAVDFHQEILDELKLNFTLPNVTFVKNNGTDFPGVPESSVDYLFSFGTFVHLDVEIIDAYLGNMKTILKPNAIAVIQYSDKTKPIAATKPDFADNNEEIMRGLVEKHGFTVYEEENRTLAHSNVMRFGPSVEDPAAGM